VTRQSAAPAREALANPFDGDEESTIGADGQFAMAPYSDRSTITGSTRDARRAGT
jgi:hypothetical protein